MTALDTIPEWLQNLLSGLLGAIFGTLLSGWFTLWSVRKQILAAARQLEITQFEECIAALRAISGELSHNQELMNANYVGYRAMALSATMWQSLASKLGPVRTDTLAAISRTYSLIMSIKSVEESDREQLARTGGQADGRTYVTTNWPRALDSVRASIEAINGELSVLTTKAAALAHR